MKHYAVILDYATDFQQGLTIYGITHTFEEAKKIFDYHIEEEKKLAEEKGWEVWVDEEDRFDASAPSYVEDHSHLYIEAVINPN